MRLHERNLVEAGLVKRIHKTDTLGGRPEAFSGEKISFRASLIPESGSLEAGRRGLQSGAKIRLLAAADLDARVGDGVFVGDAFYIVLSVNRWYAHWELICGARP